MGIFDAEDEVMADGMDQKLLEKLCRDFKIDYTDLLQEINIYFDEIKYVQYNSFNINYKK